jgi:predicted TIM-barrel fold metal-dependent hydrolase
LACSVAEMSVDRIMFSVDWPFISNALGTSWLAQSALSDGDKVKIFGGNAKKLLNL